MSDAPGKRIEGRLRPTLASSIRRNWTAWFLQEWALLLLAAAMTLAIWLNMRDDVIKNSELFPIRVVLVVEPDVRDEIGAVLNDPNAKLKIELRCSEREHIEARNALRKDGGRLAVRLNVRRPPGTGQSRSFDEVDDVFDWPFDADRILAKKPRIPEGQVFRISPQKAAVEVPATTPPAGELEAKYGLRVTIEPSVRSVQLQLPEGFFYAPLTPDPVPIDPKDYAKRLVATETVRLTFDTWSRNGTGKDWERRYREQVRIPPINAKLTVTQVGDLLVTGALIPQIDGSKYVATYDTGQLDHVSDVHQYTGKLLGPQAALDRIEKNPRGWGWGIHLKGDYEALLADKDEVKVPGEIVWLPRDEFVNAGVRHVQREGEESFDVTVRKRP